MTARSREDELREVPLWKANKERWPPGVREIAMEEQDCLGIDRRGNLYWDGKPIEVSRRQIREYVSNRTCRSPASGSPTGFTVRFVPRTLKGPPFSLRRPSPGASPHRTEVMDDVARTPQVDGGGAKKHRRLPSGRLQRQNS